MKFIVVFDGSINYLEGKKEGMVERGAIFVWFLDLNFFFLWEIEFFFVCYD